MHAPKIEKIPAVGVRRGNDGRNSIGNRRFRHGDGLLNGGGAIIKTRQNVAMQVDHSNEPSLAPPGTDSLHRAERKRIPAKIRRISRGLIHFATLPPAMPPKNKPGISNNLAFNDAKPCLEYASTATP